MNKINKIAYPQGQYDLHIGSYDLNKWIKTLHAIYLYARQGYNISKTSEQLIKDWDEMEKADFMHWMKYYQGNSQSSYKTAQYLQVAPGAYAPQNATKNFSQTNPTVPVMPDQLKADVKLPEEEDPQFKINKKIKSIISRLMSAERLATDPDVQRELSKRLDIGISKWLEELHRVKRMVQIAPIRHASSTILEDLIIKEANILAHKGFPKAARELVKIAQPVPVLAPADASPAATDAPPDAPPPVPGDAAAPPSAPPGEEAASSQEPKGTDTLAQVVKDLNLLDFEDENDDDDSNDIVDMIEDPLAAIEIKAQALPNELGVPAAEPFAPVTPEAAALTAPAKPLPAQQPKPTMTPALEVKEDTADTLVHKKTDDLLEKALSSVSIQDIIERLDTLVNLFRTREIPRQLAIIDLMMDQLNLSSFFPGLAEASSKSLESNQYALSRIEEVLSKLKGSIKNPKEKELDLLGKQPSTSPDSELLEGMRSSLQTESDKEKARKQQRKQEEQAKAEKLIPEIEVAEDLAEPVALPEAEALTPMPMPPPAPARR